MNPRHWLLKKLTREQLDGFLQAQAASERTLEIGASFKPNRALFPKAIAGDVLHYPALDVQFDAHSLPFASEQFEHVLCVEVLEHCQNPQRVIDECYRVLRPGGTLILTTRFLFPLHDAPHDYFRFTKYGLQHLCRRFQETHIQAEVPTVTTLGVLLQRLAYQADWRVPLTKVVLLLLAKAVPLLRGNLKREYGDIRHDQPAETIMTSGYYLVARKQREERTGESA